MSELFLHVMMPDESEWAVPAALIARDRAMYYESQEPGCFQDECRYAMEDTGELKDWAENNMNWEHVEKFAVLISDPSAIDFQEGWTNGDKRVLEIEPRLQSGIDAYAPIGLSCDFGLPHYSKSPHESKT